MFRTPSPTGIAPVCAVSILSILIHGRSSVLPRPCFFFFFFMTLEPRVAVSYERGSPVSRLLPLALIAWHRTLNP